MSYSLQVSWELEYLRSLEKSSRRSNEGRIRNPRLINVDGKDVNERV